MWQWLGLVFRLPNTLARLEALRHALWLVWEMAPPGAGVRLPACEPIPLAISCRLPTVIFQHLTGHLNNRQDFL